MSITIPWVPSREEVIKALKLILRPRKDDVIMDPGCGDGRVLVSLVEEFGTRGICVELREELALKAYRLIRGKGLETYIDVVVSDLYEFPFSHASIIYLYLLTSANYLLRPKLDKELKPGTIIISLDFPIPGWRPFRVIELPQSWQRTLYLYVKGYSELEDNTSQAIEVDINKLVNNRLADAVLRGRPGTYIRLDYEQLSLL